MPGAFDNANLLTTIKCNEIEKLVKFMLLTLIHRELVNGKKCLILNQAINIHLLTPGVVQMFR